ncbi:uncharacterized protein LOC135202269 [Macrobrachium nipponense]|uniref:uncharacterized protein LOC135202269 n=1 Tax=Macrobrachium nipponense TaxID=159736 RepID=UPI0030C807ED
MEQLSIMPEVADLSRSSLSERIINSWNRTSGSEKILIMVCAVLSLMFLGFTVGVIALTATEQECEDYISLLKQKLDDCRGILDITTTKPLTLFTGTAKRLSNKIYFLNDNF